jgi:hypothetical protein
MAGLPLYEAKPATIISGAEVLNPTMVRPIISGGTFMLRAVAAAPVIKPSALQMSNIKPTRTAMLFNNIR